MHNPLRYSGGGVDHGRVRHEFVTTDEFFTTEPSVPGHTRLGGSVVFIDAPAVAGEMISFPEGSVSCTINVPLRRRTEPQKVCVSESGA